MKTADQEIDRNLGNGDTRSRVGRPTEALLFAGLALLTVLLCLIPKPENDLFFELRIGTDIVRTGHLPHSDLYSWTRYGIPWDVPEWGAFVLYAAAFRAAGFFGTWLLMAVLALATTAIVWRWLSRYTSLPVAWAVTALMLLTASPTLQERPYAFTYPLLAATLILLAQGRNGSRRALWALIPVCVVWTNLHQGVLAFVCLILACAVGDGLTAALRRRQAVQNAPDLLTETGRRQAADSASDPDRPRAHAARARRMFATAVACAAAALCSPYGIGVYRSVFVTLRDRQLMANVTEWNPITVLPPSQLPPFILLSLLTLGALILSSRRDRRIPPTLNPPELKTDRPPGSLSDVLMLAALFAEAVLHARNTALFAIGAAVIAAPYFAPAGAELTRHLRLPPNSSTRGPLLAACACLCLAAATVACLTGLRRDAGPRGLTPLGIGEAVARVPTYPAAACAFLNAEDFPSHLRLLNSFEDGGYLMWRIPREPVFVDGRLDIYTGQTFNDTLILSRTPASPAADALIAKYDLDCVLTASPRQARAFAARPDWRLVYIDPTGPHPNRIFLRRRPRFALLIARCLRDRPTTKSFALQDYSAHVPCLPA